MSVRVIKQYLDKITSPVDFKLEPIDLGHKTYSVWGRNKIRVTTIPPEFREFRKIESQFDIFVNGQYVSPKNYHFGTEGNTFMIKFLKDNFEYELDETDEIIIKGDLEKYG